MPDTERVYHGRLWCPRCQTQHVDQGVWATKPHHTHLCLACGFEWRVEPYVIGVEGKALPEMRQAGRDMRRAINCIAHRYPRTSRGHEILSQATERWDRLEREGEA